MLEKSQKNQVDTNFLFFFFLFPITACLRFKWFIQGIITELDSMIRKLCKKKRNLEHIIQQALRFLFKFYIIGCIQKVKQACKNLCSLHLF